MGTLAGKTLFITGGSRGIGREIGLRAARDGANVVIAAKTVVPHPTLPGTIYSTAEEVEGAGGKAFACAMDIRSEEAIDEAVAAAVDRFGGIDILINNASALSLTGTADTPAKRFDLMHGINMRGTFLMSQACLPHLKQAENPHILNISPPLNLNPRWFVPHVAYTMAKYGMSMCVLGMAGEFEPLGIAVNALWPRTAIATSAVRNLLGGEAMVERSRLPAIMADCAHIILTRDSRTCTGNFFIDDELLLANGCANLDPYAVNPDQPLQLDFFIDDAGPSFAERAA